MSTNALRSYLRELRVMQGVTQKDLANAMGASFRTVLEWEAGRIDELKSVPLVRAIEYLNGSMNDVSLMLLQSDANADVGRELAHKRYAASQQDSTLRGQRAPEDVKIFGRYLTSSAEDVQKIAVPQLPLRDGNRLYEGERIGPQHGVSSLTVNGLPLSEQFIREFGPGFPDVEWGYAGRGPERLAYVLLASESNLTIAGKWSHRFLHDVTAHLPRGIGGLEWSLHSSQIQLWMRLTALITK